MAKSGILTWVLVGVASTCMVICGVGGYSVYQGIEQGVAAMKPLLVCTTEATALRNALIKVAEKNGGALPSTEDWKDLVASEFLAGRDQLVAADTSLPRIPDPDAKWSDPQGVWGCQIGSMRIHAYAYNSDLAGKKLSEIKDPEKSVLVFESSETTNKALPYRLRLDRTEPRVLGELRNWITVPVKGDAKDLMNPGSGSPAAR